MASARRHLCCNALNFQAKCEILNPLISVSNRMPTVLGLLHSNARGMSKVGKCGVAEIITIDFRPRIATEKIPDNEYKGLGAVLLSLKPCSKEHV